MVEKEVWHPTAREVSAENEGQAGNKQSAPQQRGQRGAHHAGAHNQHIVSDGTARHGGGASPGNLW
jgi:hypothetical protein